MHVLTLSIPNLSSYSKEEIQFKQITLADKPFEEFYKAFLKAKKKTIGVLALQMNPTIINLSTRFKKTCLTAGIKEQFKLEEKASRFFGLDKDVKKSNLSEAEFIETYFNEHYMFKFLTNLVESAVVNAKTYLAEYDCDFNLDKKSSVRINLQSFINEELRIYSKTEMLVTVSFDIKKALTKFSTENPHIYNYLMSESILTELEYELSKITTTIKIELEGRL